ncbi:MAG: hypothetical protein ACR2L2_12805 [Acidobacteriota bacterium]
MNRLLAVLVACVVGGCGGLFAQGLLDPLPVPLRLPPGLTQTLPVESDSSFIVDAFRVVNCPDDKDNPYGTCGSDVFGGFAVTGIRLSGFVSIEFAPPVDHLSRFIVTHPGGLTGADTVLRAPQFFQFPILSHKARDVAGVRSAGTLNLLTGEVTDLEYNLNFSNTGLTALRQVNPNLVIPSVRFPGSYGSAWARFEQRADGLLDYTFFGSTFLPLGNKQGGQTVRFPLPLCDADWRCASIPTPGTSLHPHLAVSTRKAAAPSCEPRCPAIPTNTILEFPTLMQQTSFGDTFRLEIPQLGGTATGRSQLHGRLQIQFGDQFGPLVPVVVSSLPPAGLLATPPATPLSLPGVSLGFIGHSEYLRFPLQTYFLRGMAFADDPFDLAIGAVDVRSGQLVGGLLYRGFIAQNLLFTLLEQNEGRIPPASFSFRGPAYFERGAAGQLLFRFDGEVRLPFAGFRFPSPDFVKAHSWIAGPGSVLDPFLQIAASQPIMRSPSVASGSGNAVATNGDVFSYRYSVPCSGPGVATFEYSNPDPVSGGSFKMRRLASVRCFSATGAAEPDTLSFTGYGDWSGDDELHVVTVQITSSPAPFYISIQIDGGTVSNVNTQTPTPARPGVP